jgi:hypothetical protein
MVDVILPTTDGRTITLPVPHRAARRHGPPARPARPDPSHSASPESLAQLVSPHAHGRVVETFEQII